MRELSGKILRKLLWSFPLMLILVGIAMLTERPAYAYADPGTGLLAIQAIGSAVVAAGWYLRRKIYAILHRGSTKERSKENPVTAETEGSSRL
jgi:hypothetical protein